MVIISKKTIFWAIAFLIAVILIAQAAYSVRILEFDNTAMLCTEDGKARFNFFYASGEGNIDLADVVVLADREEVDGGWYKHQQDPKQPLTAISSVSPGKRAMFVSDFRQFMEDRKYNVEMKYPDDDGKTRSISIEMSCPGFVFACDMFKMSLDNCYNRGGSVYLEVSGSGFGDFGANLATDFTYILKGSSKRHEGTLENSSATVEKVKEGVYLIEFPLDYPVYWAYIRGTPYGCDVTIDDFDTITYKKCTTSTTSTATSDQQTKTAAPITGASTADTKVARDTQEDGQEKQTQADELSFFGKIIRFLLSFLKI